MANKKVNISVDVDTGNADKEIKKINSGIKDLDKNSGKGSKAFKEIGNVGSKTFKEIGNVSKKTFKGIGKAVKGIGNVGSKAFKGIGNVGKKAFKGIGKAVKGMGIGLIIGVVASLFEVFKKNQAIVDAFAKVTAVIGQVVNGLVDGFKDLYKKLNESTGGFDALKAVMTGLIKIAIKPMQFAFNGIKLGIQSAQLAWEKSIFGGKDADKIKELEDKVNSTKDRIKELKDETIQSGKAVATNFSEAVGEVGQLAKGTIDVVSDVVKKTTDGTYSAIAEQSVAAEKAFERLERQREKLQIQNEQEAEKYRQQRDDITLSIEERIEANRRLGQLLTEQAEKEISIIDKQIESIRLKMKVEGENEELKNNLLDLENKRLEVNNRITGQQSEQLTNEKALLKERIENEREFQSQMSELRNETRQAEQEAILSGIDDEQERREKELEFLKENLELEREIELEALRQKLEDKLITEEEYAALIANVKTKYEAKTNAAETEYEAKTTEEKKKQDKEEAKSKKQSKQEGAQAIADAFGFEQGIQAKDTIMATYEGAQKAFNSLAEIPVVGTALGAAAAAAVVVSGMQRVAKITSQAKPSLPKFQSGGIVGGSSYSGDNVLARVNSDEMILNKQQQSQLFKMANGQSNGGGIDEERVAQIAAQTVKATPVYVVESDITETQRRASVRENKFTLD